MLINTQRKNKKRKKNTSMIGFMKGQNKRQRKIKGISRGVYKIKSGLFMTSQSLI